MIIILSGILFNFSYIIGAFYPDIIGLSFLPWISLVVLIITIGLPPFKATHILIFLSIIYLYYVGVVFSDWGSYSMYKMQMFAVKVTPLMLIPFILKDKLYKFLLGYAIPLQIFLLIAFIKSISIIGDVSINDRLEVGVYTSIWISRVALELILLFLIVFALKARYVLMAIFLAVPVIYVSGSKGPLLSFILVMLIWILKERCLNPGQRIKVGILVGILIIGAVYTVSVLSEESFFYQRFLLQVPDGSEFLNESRAVVWPLVFDKVFNYDVISILFGHGIGEFERFFYGVSTGDRYYPHNIFLELIVENGLIITTFFVGIFVYIYKSSNSPLKYIFLFAFFNAQFSGDILLNEGIFFYAGALLVANKLSSNELIVRRSVRMGRHS